MKKRKIIFILFCIITLFIAIAYRTDAVLEQYGETVLKNSVYARVNSQIKYYATDNTHMFNSLVTHQFDENGTLRSIELNSGNLAALQSGLESEILRSIAEIHSEGFNVPMGNLIGSKLFSGRGPHIKIQTMPLSTLECSMVNDFESVGINHTIHKLALVFTVSFKAAYPFGDTVFENRFQVTLCENIIIGEVPLVYVN
ncbi:MAG: sporulation protein YunB [Clostridia bacterium]|nr:sporulation protein YunB [Clostridia bacterium]